MCASGHALPVDHLSILGAQKFSDRGNEQASSKCNSLDLSNYISNPPSPFSRSLALFTKLRKYCVKCDPRLDAQYPYTHSALTDQGSACMLTGLGASGSLDFGDLCTRVILAEALSPKNRHAGARVKLLLRNMGIFDRGAVLPFPGRRPWSRPRVGGTDRCPCQYRIKRLGSIMRGMCTPRSVGFCLAWGRQGRWPTFSYRAAPFLLTSF